MDSSTNNCNPKKSNSNKIREIVRLQQILKKWKKLANAPKINATGPAHSPPAGNKSIKFLKKTLSFTESSISASSSASGIDVVPKGYLAVCVGRELKRFVIPMQYLGHQAFRILLRQAEEEFGFQQEGVLKIPCEVPVFEKILRMMEQKREDFFLHDLGFDRHGDHQMDILGCYSPPDNSDQLTPSHQPPPQLCQ